MTGSGGGTSTPRLVDSIADASGILDRPVPVRNCAQGRATTAVSVARHTFALSRHSAPESYRNLSPKEGVGNAGCPAHPQPRVRWVVEYAHEYSQRGRQNHPASPRNGLRLIPRSPRRSGFLASGACGVFSANLTPASRRQNHTPSPSASAPFVIGTSSVHRIPPRVRDDREPPLRWDETATFMEVIWVKTETEYFFLWDSTAATTPNLARRASVFARDATRRFEGREKN